MSTIHTMLNEHHANALFGLLAKAVTVAAKEQNGWTLERYWRAPMTNGLLPNGVVLVEVSAPAPKHPDAVFATVEFAVRESGDIQFHNGHYDLTWGAAINDHHGRCAGKV